MIQKMYLRFQGFANQVFKNLKGDYDEDRKMQEHAKVLSGMGSAKMIEIRENDRN